MSRKNVCSQMFLCLSWFCWTSHLIFDLWKRADGKILQLVLGHRSVLIWELVGLHMLQ